MAERNASHRNDSDSDDLAVRTDNQGADDENAPDPVEGMLDNAPPSVRREVSRFMAVSGQIGNPLLAKFNADHIHKALDYGERENQRDHQQAHSARWFLLAIFLFAVVAVVGVLVFLVWQGERELAGQILAGLAIFGGGFGGGYGLGRRR